MSDPMSEIPIPDGLKLHLGEGRCNIKAGLAIAPGMPEMGTVPVVIVTEIESGKCVTLFFHSPEAVFVLINAFASLAQAMSGLPDADDTAH